MKIKKKPKFNLNSVVRGAIRRVFVRSPQFQETLKAARKEEIAYNKDGNVSKKKDVYYKCAICNKYKKRKEISVDHIIPVIDPFLGFESWDKFVEKLFCAASNLQCICDECHDKKSEQERILRKKFKQESIINSEKDKKEE